MKWFVQFSFPPWGSASITITRLPATSWFFLRYSLSLHKAKRASLELYVIGDLTFPTAKIFNRFHEVISGIVVGDLTFPTAKEIFNRFRGGSSLGTSLSVSSLMTWKAALVVQSGPLVKHRGNYPSFSGNSIRICLLAILAQNPQILEANHNKFCF